MEDAWVSMTLAELPVGESATIATLPTGSAAITRLREMGLVPGTVVRVVRRAPFGEPIEISLRGSNLAMRNHEAARIGIRRGGESRAAGAETNEPASGGESSGGSDHPCDTGGGTR